MCEDHKYKTKTFKQTPTELPQNMELFWCFHSHLAEPVVFIHLENKIKNLEVHQEHCLSLVYQISVRQMW